MVLPSSPIHSPASFVWCGSGAVIFACHFSAVAISASPYSSGVNQFSERVGGSVSGVAAAAAGGSGCFFGAPLRWFALAGVKSLFGGGALAQARASSICR